MSPDHRMSSSEWMYLFIPLAILPYLVSSAILHHGGATHPDSDADDYGTELNSLDVGIRPGNTVVQYDEEGVWICPETFDLTFDLEQKPFSIRLVRAPGIRSTKVPIFIATSKNNASLYQRKITKQYCNYQDIYTISSFTISLHNNRYILDGTFRNKGKLFGIRPREFNSKRSKRSAENDHSLFLLAKDENFSESNSYLHSRRKRQAKDRYEVEVLAVIDSSVYERFESMAKGDTEEEKSRQTVENISYHFSHVMNEVSMRFAGIVDQDYEIRVVVASFLISESSVGSPWTDHSADKNDIYTLLTRFQHFMNNVFPLIVSLPDYDHAVLFTRKDLHNLRGDPNIPDGLLGGSTITGACSYQRMSAIESKDIFTTAFASAHELAHNLGAYHDGEHNTCPVSAMHLMAPNKQIRTAANYRNIFEFSSCSKAELKIGLEAISRNYTCLYRTTPRDRTEYKNHLSTPPGQKYTLDQQCQAIVDDDSYFCGKEEEAESICGKMVCWFSKQNGCGTYKDQPAEQGTTCGDRKWCVDGRCVYNTSAPSVDPTCIFGDTTKPVFEEQKCGEVIAQYPFACYIERNKKLCCASCAKAYQPNEVGCEYGDKDGSCKNLSPLEELCPQPGIGDLCCETCKKYVSRPRGDGTVRNPVNNNNNRNDNNNNNNRNDENNNDNENNRNDNNNNNDRNDNANNNNNRNDDTNNNNNRNDNTNNNNNRNDNTNNNNNRNDNINNNNRNDDNNRNTNVGGTDCGRGWTYSQSAGICYRLTNQIPRLRWSDAKQLCEGMGGGLATPKTPQQNRAVENFTWSANAHNTNVWIGLFHPSSGSYSPNINDRRRGWQWVDGSTADQSSWGAWDDREPGEGETWVRMRYGRWLAIGVETDAVYGLCQKQTLSQTPVVPSQPESPAPAPGPVQPQRQNGQNGACGSSDWTFSTRVNLCYWISNINQFGITWSSARGVCASRGGDLATPRNAEENAEVLGVIRQANADDANVWIGLYHNQGPQAGSVTDRRRDWTWVDGRTYDNSGWTNWDVDEPGIGERWVRQRRGRWLAINNALDGKYAMCQKTPQLQ